MSDIALEPSRKRRTLKVTPPGYESLPAEQQPVYEFRRLSVRKFRDAALFDERFKAAQSLNEKLDVLISTLQPLMVGWQNVTDDEGNPVDYDPSRLEDVTDLNEANYLLQAALKGGVKAEDVKNSTSPQQ